MTAQFTYDQLVKITQLLMDENAKLSGGVSPVQHAQPIVPLVAHTNGRVPFNRNGVSEVAWGKEHRQWLAQIWIENKCVNLGTFDQLEDAEIACSEGENKFFPEGLPISDIPYSGFQGISWNTRSQKWRSQTTIGKEHRHIGNFATLEEAKTAFIKVVLEAYPPLKKNNVVTAKVEIPQSGIKGIYWNKGSKKWVVQFRSDGKSRYVGQYNELEDAKVAYSAESLKHHPDEQIKMADETQALSEMQGIYWNSAKKVWCVLPTINGQKKFCGEFSELENAKAAYIDALGTNFIDFDK